MSREDQKTKADNNGYEIKYTPHGREVMQMSELDIFHMYIPQIAELIVICQNMNQKEYEDWKIETIKTIPIEAVVFMEKIFIVVDRHVCRKMKMGA